MTSFLSSLRMSFTSPAKTYFRGTRMLTEHVGQIDFRTSEGHSRWRIATTIPTSVTSTMTAGMQKHKLHGHFFMGTKIMSEKTIGLTFMPIAAATRAEVKEGRRKLIKLLHGMKVRIIWKEDLHGYEISESGRIVRKWELGVKRSSAMSQLDSKLPPETLRSLCALSLIPPFKLRPAFGSHSAALARPDDGDTSTLPPSDQTLIALPFGPTQLN